MWRRIYPEDCFDGLLYEGTVEEQVEVTGESKADIISGFLCGFSCRSGFTAGRCLLALPTALSFWTRPTVLTDGRWSTLFGWMWCYSKRGEEEAPCVAVVLCRLIQDKLVDHPAGLGAPGTPWEGLVDHIGDNKQAEPIFTLISTG